MKRERVSLEERATQIANRLAMLQRAARRFSAADEWVAVDATTEPAKAASKYVNAVQRARMA
jgi:hypothetical protein